MNNKVHPHDLYWLAAALEDEYARALRAKFPTDAAYIGARYTNTGDPRIEGIKARARAAFNAWSHACKQTERAS